jgi:flagellar hook protein FlgE
MLMDGDRTFYTRTGSFEVNADGFIVLAGTDYKLAMLDATGRPVSLSIDSSRTSPPQKTTTIKFDGNLSYTGETSGATDTSFTINDVKVYDSGGGQHIWRVQFNEKSARGPHEWDVTVTDATGAAIGTKALKFGAAGIVDPTTASLVFAKDNLSVTLDFGGSVTSFSAGTVQSLRAASVDGRGAGTLTTVTINAEGQLELGYSNSDKVKLGAIALAQFREPQLLEQRSGGLFVNNDGQDAPELRTSEDDRVGRVVARRLEASNVDLAKEFGELILIQRGFQASSQIVSISNDMIQQLFGIRGQG